MFNLQKNLMQIFGYIKFITYSDGERGSGLGRMQEHRPHQDQPRHHAPRQQHHLYTSQADHKLSLEPRLSHLDGLITSSFSCRLNYSSCGFQIHFYHNALLVPIQRLTILWGIILDLRKIAGSGCEV